MQKGNRITYLHGQQCVSDEKPLLPVKKQAPIEVPARLDSRDAWQHGLSCTLYESVLNIGDLRAMPPDSVLHRGIHWTLEGMGPFDVSCVEMRMRDHYASEAAENVDLCMDLH